MTQQAQPACFVIRAATRSDAQALTTLHCAAFQPGEHIPVLLGRDYVLATYRWLTNTNEGYCLVADCGDKLIGFIGIYDSSYVRPMFFACLPAMIGSILRRPGLLLEARLWRRLLRRPDVAIAGKRVGDRSGFAQVTAVAVDAEHRHGGVFLALVDAAYAYSKNRGSRAIRSGVYKTNEPSRWAFKKAGWIETPELETKDTVFCVRTIDREFLSDLTPFQTAHTGNAKKHT